MKSANIISLNETHFVQKDTLTMKMMGITQHDHNNTGGGVALIMNKKFTDELLKIVSKLKMHQHA